MEGGPCGDCPSAPHHTGLGHRWGAALGHLPVRADRGHAGSLQLNCCGSNTLTSVTTSVFRNSLCPSSSNVIDNWFKVRVGGAACLLPTPPLASAGPGSRLLSGLLRGSGSHWEGRGHTEFPGPRQGALPGAEFCCWSMEMASLCPAPTGSSGPAASRRGG